MTLLIKSILQKSSVKTVSRRACALALVLIVCFSSVVPVFAANSPTSVEVPADNIIASILIGLGLLYDSASTDYNTVLNNSRTVLANSGYISSTGNLSVIKVLDSVTNVYKWLVNTDIISLIRQSLFEDSVLTTSSSGNIYDQYPILDISTVWTDTSSYPYAYLIRTSSTQFQLLMAPEAAVAPSSTSITYPNNTLSSYSWPYSSNASNHAWTSPSSLVKSGTITVRSIIWTSDDLYDNDGNLILPGSNISGNTIVSTSTDITLGSVAPSSDSLSSGYPSWASGEIVSNSVTYYPVSFGNTLEESLNQTQDAVYTGTSNYVETHPVVTSVSISTANQVVKGSSVPVSVSVLGDGDFDSEVSLTVSGNTSNLTYVVPTGVSDNVSTFDLYCGSNETAFTLALTATSVSDPTISSTYNIVVQAASTGTNPGESLNPSVPSDTVPRIDTSFDNTQVYCPLGQTIGLMFSAYGYPNMHLKYYEFGSLKSETDLVFDSSNSVLYGGFYVAPEIQDSYTQVRIDAYSDDVLVSSYFTTVVCSDPPSADGSDQVIIDALESVGVSQEEIKESLTTVQSTVDEILSGGDSAGDLTDSGASITDNMTIVEEFENQHKDTIDSGLSGITSDIDYSGLVPALSFLTGYLNIAWSGLGGIALIFTVPMFLGVFFYLCSRTPGSSIIRDSFKPKNNNTDSKKDV